MFGTVNNKEYNFLLQCTMFAVLFFRSVTMNVEHEVTLLIQEIKRLGEQGLLYSNSNVT